MEFLRNLFGNFASGIIRLLVAVGILAAVYVFIVKPVLDTTDKAIDSANKSLERSLGPGADITDIGGTIEDVNRKVQREIRKSFKAAENAGGRSSDKLIRCIKRARGDVHKIQRCTARF